MAQSTDTTTKPHVRGAPVQAHRGFSALYPENTLLALRKGFEAGAARVEVDLGLSADGELVLIHDETLDRTTDGRGLVGQRTLRELKRLDAGSWRDPRFAGEMIPTLREVLALDVGTGEFNLEIKTNRGDPATVLRIVELAARLVHRSEATDRVIFSSFDLGTLLEVRRRLPAVRLLLIDWNHREGVDLLEAAITERLYGWTQTDRLADPARIARARDAGLYVQVGTQAGPAALEWLQHGAHGLSVDDPETMVGLVRSFAWQD